ncbi:autophagy protein 16 [Meredithblackwellia eburnea MCA 4105]
MASWIEQIHASLVERDILEKRDSAIIDSYRRLAKQTVLLKDRNAALLKASRSVTSSAAGGSTISNQDNPVRAALVTSLETQLAQVRAELSEQYKTQASNAQRLLTLTDQLRDAEERGREERDELRRLKHEVEGLRERARWHKEVVAEKEKQLLILQDDHASLELELSQVTQQNENLKIDNSSLLQRWLESKNEEASRMNEANQWVQEAKTLRTPKSSTTDARKSPIPSKRSPTPSKTSKS